VACRSLILAALACWFVTPQAARAEEWPGFRGPSGQGVSCEANPPLHWGGTLNLAWQTDIPGIGWSSPIIWGNRIFLTATTDGGASCHVICAALNTGKIFWDVEAFRQQPAHKEGRNSDATPTPVTDGKCVYAVFSSGKAVALDMDGKPVWKDEDFHFYSQQGLGVSPILYKGLVILPWDHSSEKAPLQPGWIKPWDQSYILALDAQTGQVRYKAMRGMTRASHSTPMVIDVEGRAQLISPAGDFVQAFDPLTGQKLWEVHNKGETPVPSVVYGDGLIFTTSGFEDPTIRATRPGAANDSGDLTSNHIAWECKKAVPMIPSFVFDNHLLYAIKESGIGLCLEAATGKVLWQERFGAGDASFSASPLLTRPQGAQGAGGRIYYLSEQGETTVIEPGREFKLITQNPPPGAQTTADGHETFKASIAVSAGRFLLRSDKRLYCIQEAQVKP
jgi:outer membrane protein assembly factor BamB